MVMNKILFFTLSLVMAITAYGQNSASVDTLQTASDSTSSVHMRNSLLQDKKAM